MFGRKFKKGDRVIVNDPDMMQIVDEPGTIVKVRWFGPVPYEVEIDSYKDNVMGELLAALLGQSSVPCKESELTKVDADV